MGDRVIRGCFVAAAVAVLLFPNGHFAHAQSLRQGNRHDYVSASRIIIPLAARGNAAAQAYLDYLFDTGRGVPQNYTEAAMWYRRAAEQGDSLAQYSLGLLYDRGMGVPRDIVEASKWLNLSTAAAPPRASPDPRCRHHQDDARGDRGGASRRWNEHPAASAEERIRST
ncbi:tetratricopeptide repeat protein [Bradyrhizobium sp. UFLA05-153]